MGDGIWRLCRKQQMGRLAGQRSVEKCLHREWGRKRGMKDWRRFLECPFILWGFFVKYRKSFDKPPCDPIEKVNRINVFRLKVNDLKIMV